MKHNKIHLTVFLALLISACASTDKGTLGSLNKVDIEIKEEVVDDSLDKAMESYEKFLEETPETAMTPEAMRRLADLKLEKEYGIQTDEVQDKGDEKPSPSISAKPQAKETQPPSPATPKAVADKAKEKDEAKPPTPGPEQATSAQPQNAIADHGGESLKDFEKRTTQAADIGGNNLQADVPQGVGADLQSANASEAIDMYKNLLEKYPMFERNDQVLYQLSRAYEETGQVDEAMVVLNQLVKNFPNSRHLDEAQFRRAEYFFVRKKFLDAEEAYQAVLHFGVGSPFYELALYKKGWSLFKQELYEMALNEFIALLDYKVSVGYNFEQTEDKIEKKRMDDNFRVISLSFSYLGGPPAIVRYFEKNGAREYEPDIYSHLGEHYLDKRRYADAAKSYNTYVERNPLNKVSPHFQMRVIEIYEKGGFPKLVVEAKKDFAETYRLSGTYWSYFSIEEFPKVLAFIKTNLQDLANHYHALYQDPKHKKNKQAHFSEATHWYRIFLESFPKDDKAPEINYQLAGLLLEHEDFRAAAVEFERTAYDYPRHNNSSEAGFSAVYAYREYLKVATPAESSIVKRSIIRSSLKFAETYPEHKKAVKVMVAAIEDLYNLKDFENAIMAGRKMLDMFPTAKPAFRRSAWRVIAHSSFETAQYVEAEQAYLETLELTKEDHEEHTLLVENLAASIYKQGEHALKLEDYQAAADHFLRVATAAPTSTIRPTAEYDAAAAFISLENWPRAIEVLTDFRRRYPDHELQPEVTKKLAIAYKSSGQLLFAAGEFERIERESTDDNLRREALMQAAELYEQADEQDKALAVYHRYVDYFAEPVEFNVEIRQKIAGIYQKKDDESKRLEQLRLIVKMDAEAGEQRTDRTRFLAAKAGLVLAEPLIGDYQAVRLVKPFKKNLDIKKRRMQKAVNALSHLLDYEVGEVTAASTYHLAEIYYDFSRSLMNSERPDNLSALELEQYNLVLEEQAYPFEEKAIFVHEKNMELLEIDIYNPWIDKSLAKLAKLMPARYAREEVKSEYVAVLHKSLLVSPATLHAQNGPKPDAAITDSGSQSNQTVEDKPVSAPTPVNAQQDAVANPAPASQTNGDSELSGDTAVTPAEAAPDSPEADPMDGPTESDAEKNIDTTGETRESDGNKAATTPDSQVGDEAAVRKDDSSGTDSPATMEKTTREDVEHALEQTPPGENGEDLKRAESESVTEEEIQEAADSPETAEPSSSDQKAGATPQPGEPATSDTSQTEAVSHEKPAEDGPVVSEPSTQDPAENDAQQASQPTPVSEKPDSNQAMPETNAVGDPPAQSDHSSQQQTDSQE